MDMDALDRLERLFRAAQLHPPEERAAFVEAACAGDPELRKELEALLRADEAAEAEAFLETPAARAAAPPPDSAPASSFPLPEPAQPGQTLAQYEILSKLGGGGMGLVYKARDRRLGRLVALKLLPAYLDTSPQAKERFVQEARAASALNHPNICTVYDVGETEDNRLFLAMACYEGKTLKDKIARHPLPLEKALRYTRQIAEGLAAAHATGIVHRDVKPANVMITEEDRVKLLDFGIAKVDSAQLTRAGAPLGTVAYMSPEQARGEAVDQRADLWALGVVLYEMLTGERPFRGMHDQAVLYSILHEEPTPVQALRPEVPEALAEIVAKLLRKAPQERYRRTEDVLRDLEQIDLNAGPFMLKAAARQFRRKRSWMYGGAAVLLLLLLAIFGQRIFIEQKAPPGALAVLPLANYSGDPAQAYFADGLTDELIASLGQIEALRVISRTSAMRYKEADKSLPEIARELNVGTIVEGSVRQEEDRVQIRLRLIDGRTEERLWEQRFEGALEDVLALQQEAALAIAGVIEVTPTAEEEARLASAPAVDPEAFALYLKGVQLQNQRTYASHEQAIGSFEHSIAIDSGFAPAYARLAQSYALLWTLPPEVAASKARQAAEQALQINPMLPEAYLAQGLIRQFYDWDWTGAERAFRQGLRLSPGNDEIHHELAHLLMRLGRFQEALSAENRALYFNPLSVLYQSGLGSIYFFSGAYDRAIEETENALHVDPDRPVAHFWLSRAYAHSGRHEDAFTAWPKGPFAERPFAEALALSGRHEEAHAELRRLTTVWERGEGSRFTPWEAAVVCAALGEHERTLTWLERAYDAHTPLLTYLKVDPAFDRLHTLPRFQALSRKLGLEEGASTPGTRS